MERLLDWLAQSGAQQKQLHEMVERLVRENEELREEITHLRNRVTHLTGQRAETAQALESLAAYVAAVKDQVLRQSREGRSSE
jgi:regulator of replication initiation timing